MWGGKFTTVRGDQTTGFSSRCLGWGKCGLQRSFLPGSKNVLKIISDWAFEGEMVVTNSIFVLEKFFINVFPLKDFLNSQQSTV